MLKKKFSGLVILLAGLAMVLVLPSSGFAEGLGIGETAPNIIGRNMDGKMFQLTKAGNGPKVINFFWVKCVPCKKELPELGLYEKHFTNVSFIAVHVMMKDDAEIKPFIKKLPGAPSTVVSADLQVMERYRFKGLPHTVVLNGNGKVLLTLEGYKPENMTALKELLEKLN